MDFSIVLPAFNEAENLPPLVRNIKKELDKIRIKYEIIVVDNGSIDNTQEVIQSLKTEVPELKSVKVWPNIGFGNGIIQGLLSANGRVLGFMDADRQFKAEDLAKIYLKLKKEDLDICKGFRITRHDGWQRKLASQVFHLIFKIMFFADFKDLNGKPKVFSREIYERANLTSKDWFLDAEIMIKAQKGRYKVGEMPIVALPRPKGASKVRVGTVFEFIKNLFYYRFFNKF